MNKNYATISASRAIDTLLDRGAEKLYDKYLQQKLPNHASHLNDQQVQANIKTLSIKQPQKQSIDRVTLEMAKTIPVDSLATKRVRHQFKETSNFSPKNTTIDKSTKYQTVIQSQQMINQSFDQSKDLQQSLLLQEESYRRDNIFHRSQRPSTMQNPRSSLRGRENQDTLRQNKLEQIEQKRAATCHVRKRKSFASLQAQKQKLIRLKQEKVNIFYPQQMQLQQKVRVERQERAEKQFLTERQKAMQIAKIRMKDIRTIQNYEQLKQKLRGKSKVPIPVTNFQNENGQIVINGRSKVPQTHIIQLSFNPEQANVFHSLEPRHSNVHPTKTKSFFSSKLSTIIYDSEKKLKLSNEEFTNNGSRQISSIPFIALNYGILISEAGLQATASRRRPVEEVTRKEYIEENFNARFKSHIPIVNSARIKLSNAFEAQDLTARSSIEPIVSIQKNMQTTNQSKIQMQKSLLWNPRGKSQGKEIKVSNKHILQQEILESKMGLQS